MNLKNGKLFTSKFVGTGPSSYKKRIYRPAVSQKLRNTGICDTKSGLLAALTLNLLTTTIVAPPSNASKWQMGFNSAFKGLMRLSIFNKFLFL